VPNEIPTMIVPTLNGQERLKDLFASIDYPIGEVIIINNDYAQPVNVSSDYVDWVHVLNMPNNLGVAASWNLGIKSSPRNKYWLIVNDDVTFALGSLRKFAEHIEAHGTISLCSDVSPWSAFAIGEDIVWAVGLFDEAFYPAYFEDTDYARRARAIMGEDVIYYTDIPVYHATSSTINNGYASENKRTYRKNYETYENKKLNNNFSEIGWSLNVRRENDWGV
jgi:GT2 family glycosyltransferase